MPAVLGSRLPPSSLSLCVIWVFPLVGLWACCPSPVALQPAPERWGCTRPPTGASSSPWAPWRSSRWWLSARRSTAAGWLPSARGFPVCGPVSAKAQSGRIRIQCHVSAIFDSPVYWKLVHVVVQPSYQDKIINFSPNHRSVHIFTCHRLRTILTFYNKSHITFPSIIWDLTVIYGVVVEIVFKHLWVKPLDIFEGDLRHRQSSSWRPRQAF